MNGTPGRAKGGGGVSATLAAAADDDAPGTRQALRTWHGAAVEHRAAAAAAAATRERATLSSRIHELQSALFRADANERSRTAYGYLQGLQLQHAHEETARLRRSLAATHGERTVQRTEILHLAARLTLERSARHAAFADELDSLALRCPPPAGEKRHALADELQRLAAKLGVANGATVGAAAGGDAAAGGGGAGGGDGGGWRYRCRLADDTFGSPAKGDEIGDAVRVGVASVRRGLKTPPSRTPVRRGLGPAVTPGRVL